ncbi:MAG: hypothetical protein J0G96_03950 [Flavobacteriia bacterium]|nr:hypothetical protein [Flavobacteriia bacterium]OJX37653.1 MAG: hypothetical protein BGO87_11320 [Flavobacteriia bacterium 40-80]
MDSKLNEAFSSWFDTQLSGQEKEQVLIRHFGYFQEDFVYRLTEIIEKRLLELKFSYSVARKVFASVSEAISNINKHGKSTALDVGGLIVCVKEDKITVSVSNIIPVSGRISLSSKIDELNELNKEELSSRFHELMKRSIVSNTTGFGIGFVSIRLNCDTPLKYSFKPLEAGHLIFSMEFEV